MNFTFGPGGPASPLGPKSPGSPRDPCRTILGRRQGLSEDVPCCPPGTEAAVLEKPALEMVLQDHLPSWSVYCDSDCLSSGVPMSHRATRMSQHYCHSGVMD